MHSRAMALSTDLPLSVSSLSTVYAVKLLNGLSESPAWSSFLRAKIWWNRNSFGTFSSPLRQKALADNWSVQTSVEPVSCRLVWYAASRLSVEKHKSGRWAFLICVFWSAGFLRCVSPSAISSSYVVLPLLHVLCWPTILSCMTVAMASALINRAVVWKRTSVLSMPWLATGVPPRKSAHMFISSQHRRSGEEACSSQSLSGGISGLAESAVKGVPKRWYPLATAPPKGDPP